MKKHINSGFRLANITRWASALVFVLIAYLLFDIRVSIYTSVVAILSHELPTMAMGLYIANKIGWGKHGYEEND